jgi:hypothetical protein
MSSSRPSDRHRMPEWNCRLAVAPTIVSRRSPHNTPRMTRDVRGARVTARELHPASELRRPFPSRESNPLRRPSWRALRAANRQSIRRSHDTYVRQRLGNEPRRVFRAVGSISLSCGSAANLCSTDQFSRTMVNEPARAAGRTTHPAFSVMLQPSTCRVVPSSGRVTGTESVVPSAERKTPLSALRRPHRAERVKL